MIIFYKYFLLGKSNKTLDQHQHTHRKKGKQMTKTGLQQRKFYFARPMNLANQMTAACKLQIIIRYYDFATSNYKPSPPSLSPAPLPPGLVRRALLNEPFAFRGGAGEGRDS